MPTFARKTLRIHLGTERLNDLILGTTNIIVGSGAAATLFVLDPVNAILVDASLSGTNLYQRSWLRVASFDYRVASANFLSGALVTGQMSKAAVASGADFELHLKVSAAEKDRCIDETIARIRTVQEVGIPVVTGQQMYAIDGAASPNTVLDVLDTYWFADPTSTTNRQRHDFMEKPVLAQTATGMELRLPYALTIASSQIVMKALLQMSLGAGDAATINIPQIQDDQWILDGAAARVYDLLINKAPSTEVGQYIDRRRDMANSFTDQSRKYQPSFDTNLGFETSFEGFTWDNGGAWGNW